MAQSAARVARQFNPEELLPAAADPEGMPNRIAALPAAGRGQGRVRSAVQAVRETWKSWMACVSGRVIKVPGIPGVSRSMAGLEVSDYAQQWEATHVALPEPTLQRAFAWVTSTIALGHLTCKTMPSAAHPCPPSPAYPLMRSRSTPRGTTPLSLLSPRTCSPPTPSPTTRPPTPGLTVSTPPHAEYHQPVPAHFLTVSVGWFNAAVVGDSEQATA